ncbi:MULTISPECIES: hypothetical protein [unclassified Flammeovirga]|uniref:hypothetical protein n=1 Tax=unclassified Flammeovirga TaxID=2637820 RepID=UPI0005C5573D|nr:MULTISPECIES: hypothetical protein [unclassified Flammeovirga]MBD0403263.1 hypothetical protein [Flammeovirga sp. EKP202]
MNQFNSTLLDTIPFELDFKWSLKVRQGIVHSATFAFKVLSDDVFESREGTENIIKELLCNHRFREDFQIEDVNHNELVVYKTIVGQNPEDLNRKMELFKRWVRQAQQDARLSMKKFTPTL